MTGNPSNPNRLPVLVNLTSRESYLLDSTSVTIGRSPECTVVLSEDGYASANHCRIFYDKGQWWIEDLNSSNGTTVNDEIVSTPRTLSPGLTIKVGRTLFRIE